MKYIKLKDGVTDKNAIAVCLLYPRVLLRGCFRFVVIDTSSLMKFGSFRVGIVVKSTSVTPLQLSIKHDITFLKNLQTALGLSILCGCT